MNRDSLQTVTRLRIEHLLMERIEDKDERYVEIILNTLSLQLRSECLIDINKIQAKGFTPMTKAAELGQLRIIQQLVQHGALINQTDQFGNTALLSTAKYGHSGIFEYLLDRDADINQKNKKGYTPLIAASRNGHWKIVKTLLAAKARTSPVDKDSNSALSHAIVKGWVKTVQALLQACPSLTRAETRLGYSPLMLASKHGHVDIVKLLISSGSDVNFKTRDGNSAFILSAIS